MSNRRTKMSKHNHSEWAEWRLKFVAFYTWNENVLFMWMRISKKRKQRLQLRAKVVKEFFRVKKETLTHR